VVTSSLLGLNRAAAVEVCSLAGQDPTAPVRDWAALARAGDEFHERVQAGRFAATWYPEAKQATPWPYASLSDEVNIQYESFSTMFNTLWGGDWMERRAARARSDLLARLADGREKLDRRLRAQGENLAALVDVDRWQRQGELLLSAVGKTPSRGSVTVVDYRADPPETLSLAVDPRLSVSDNAQACFNRYKKGLRGRTALAEQLAKGELERRWLDELQTAVETAIGDAELEDVAQQFRGVRSAPVEKRRARRGVVRRAPIRAYRIEGFQVLVGRNPRENEEISLRMAEPDDIWLHARQVPGAHVVIRGAAAPEAVLRAAAALAAAHSGARTSAKVAVDYTRARYVRKVPGAPPGLVTYRQEKTVMVRPGLVQQ
jgi:predicted ribosome quality control (RQC) complex YloA/Tae2 family protein